MTLSLSTSWNSQAHHSGRAMIDEIRALGFDSVELNFSLNEEMINEILSMSEAGLIHVSSLHNMCPLPSEIDRQKASPDFYSLSSLDSQQRQMAIAAAKNTLTYASRFGARAVVIHAGRIEMKDMTRQLASVITDKEAVDALRIDVMRRRREAAKGYLENAIASLDELVTFAKKLGVAIGIENRYYYREMPIFEEFETIFERFKPGDLYYWHDVGHAEVFDRLGLASHDQLLARFSSRLIGIHLHDIIGPMSDHRPPGLGSFDFTRLRPFIRPDTIKVMEPHAPTSADEIVAGKAVLRHALNLT